MFQNLHVHTNLEIPEKGVLNLSTFIQKVSGCFEIVLDETTLVLSGRILLPENKEEEFNKTVIFSSETAFNLTSNEVYNEMEVRGYQYKDHFRGILNAQVAEQDIHSKDHVEHKKGHTHNTAFLQLRSLTQHEAESNMVLTLKSLVRPRRIWKISLEWARKRQEGCSEVDWIELAQD
ncbi:unnamed protein product [Timema podura]|uniref:Uncharacterized protein n=1 Tax=Timema podura TaxID=61482 RepID=A0ABN7NJC4_TIMPD|nr:unnamed protein product [Timema podura]